MIIPIMILFQILMGATLYGTNIIINLKTDITKYKNILSLFTHVISQITLQKTVATFHLDKKYFNNFFLLYDKEKSIFKDQKSKFLLIQVMIHQELVPDMKEFDLGQETKEIIVPERKHRIDREKLYYPYFYEK
jgi:hypothetical protein